MNPIEIDDIDDELIEVIDRVNQKQSNERPHLTQHNVEERSTSGLNEGALLTQQISTTSSMNAILPDAFKLFNCTIAHSTFTLKNELVLFFFLILEISSFLSIKI